MALPGEFQFQHQVSGVAATDLFNLNTFLGAGIEMEVVRTLNAMRHIWDKDGEWSAYRFERSSQAFPDVRLTSQGERREIALGIELKGWWLLAKEGVPSLRYRVAPAACTPWDLVCVVPWYLDNAVSGKPVAAEPWVELALYAAEWRDWWWQHLRDADGTDTTITYPTDAVPYPTKADRVAAKPKYDGGNNYGRLPRCRPLMDSFIESSMATPILGIQAGAWVKFLKLHADTAGRDAVEAALQKALAKRDKKRSVDLAVRMMVILDDLGGLLS